MQKHVGKACPTRFASWNSPLLIQKVQMKVINKTQFTIAFYLIKLIKSLLKVVGLPKIHYNNSSYNNSNSSYSNIIS